MAHKLRIPAEIVRNNFSFLGDHIDVEALQKHLKGHQLLKPTGSAAEKVLDSDDNSSADKATYLVQRALSLGQRGTDALIQLLQIDRSHVGHVRVLDKLQADPQLLAEKYSSVLQVLDDVAGEIPSSINIRELQVSLKSAGVITSGDIQRFRNLSLPDTVNGLVAAVKDKGVAGLIKLLHSLESAQQAELAQSLKERVQEFIDEGCSLSEEDSKILQDAKFHVNSLVRKLENGAHAVPIVQREVLHDGAVAADNVLVVISMTNYMVLEDKGEELIAQEFDGHQLSNSMLLVKDAFKKMAFTVVDFGPNLELWNRNPAERTGLLVVEFMKRVSSCCSNSCQVIVLVTGLASWTPNKDHVTTRLLIEGVPRYSKQVRDCLTEEDLKACLDTLPTPFVTVIADNHVDTDSLSVKFRKPGETHIHLWRNLCTFNSQRVVISYCCKYLAEKQAKTVQPFGLIVKAMVNYLNHLGRNPERVPISHRQLCDMMTLYCSCSLGSDCNILPCVQGDADRAVFGHTNYPYQLHFPTKISISADSSSLSLASFNVQQITVPYGEILGLMKDGVVKLGHLCRPKELLSGRVISSSLFSCEVAVDDIETLQQLLADIYNNELADVLSTAPDWVHMICVYPSFTDLRCPVQLDTNNVERELKDYIANQSQLLRLAREREFLRVRKKGEQYMIEDGFGEIKMKSYVSNVQQVKSFLEKYARFKVVKNLLTANSRLKASAGQRQTCIMYQYNSVPLLTSAMLQSGDLTLRSSPSIKLSLPWHKNDSEESLSVTLSDNSSTLWVDLNFAKVRLLKSVKVKVDEMSSSHEEENASGAVKLSYRSKTPMEKEQCGVPTSSDTVSNLKLIGKGRTSAVRVKIVKLTLLEEEDCNTLESGLCGVGFRLSHHFNEVDCVVRQMKFLNYDELIAANYNINPPPAKDCSLMITEDQSVYVTAPRGSNIPLYVDIKDLHLVKLELNCPSQSGVNPVRAVRIEGFSKDWTTIQFSTRSIFSTEFNLPTPVRVSDLRLVPIGMKHSRLQMQMYGNQSPVGESLLVNEGEIIHVLYSYSYDHNVYLSIICMEETGMVSSVVGLEKLMRCRRDKNKILGWEECNSHFIETFIPDNYPLRGSEIRDTYKVISSSQPLNLLPVCQSGANDYYSPHVLDLAATLTQDSTADQEFSGHESWWCDHEVFVRVQRRRQDQLPY